MIVRLYDHAGTALIVPHPTGIIYTNQAGGHACLQPQVEGFVVPIANDVGLAPEHRFISPENQLFKYFNKLHSCGHPLTERDAKAIESIFHQLPIWGGLSVDRSRLNESVESWVYVNVSAHEQGPLPVDGLSFPLEAILTWTNCD